MRHSSVPVPRRRGTADHRGRNRRGCSGVDAARRRRGDRLAFLGRVVHAFPAGRPHDRGQGERPGLRLGPAAELDPLAIPVRLFPDQGALWGAAIACVVASSLAIEAAWSMGRWTGAVIASAAVLVLVMTRPDLIADLVWNPTTGIFWLLATVACGCVAAAVGSAGGRWPCSRPASRPNATSSTRSRHWPSASSRSSSGWRAPSRDQRLGGRWWIASGIVTVAAGFHR